MNKKISFNKPLKYGNEDKHMLKVVESGKLCGDGEYTKMCQQILSESINSKVLLTTSCTSALEMAAMLLGIKNGDEVIMPSFTFVSTANAFAMFGAKINFVDIDPKTMNIDPKEIERAITKNTKAIVPVHYAGVACDMDIIIKLAKENNIFIVEDAAQGFPSMYKDQVLGTLGDIGCYSFHETKNYTMGEGGAIIINNKDFLKRAEILWEKGTNRKAFVDGLVDKYTWVDKGSSFLPSELNAAYLYDGLKNYQVINDKRLALWNYYFEKLHILKSKREIDFPVIPKYAKHNAHMFYIKVRDERQRSDLIEYLKERGIMAVFHYVPLHSSNEGRRCGVFVGDDRYTTLESKRLLRLPIYYNMTFDDVEYVSANILNFFS